MSEYKQYKVGYVDSDGKFVAFNPVTDISITSSNFGNKITVSAYNASCFATESYVLKACMDAHIANMFKQIKDYKVYGKTTVVFFADGTKSTVTCNEEDNFDVEQGITMCVIKRMFSDTYKKDVRAVVKAKTLKEKNLKKLEAANKEAQLRDEKREKKNRENKLKMKARYEARLAVAIEEERKKLKKQPLNS